MVVCVYIFLYVFIGVFSQHFIMNIFKQIEKLKEFYIEHLYTYHCKTLPLAFYCILLYTCLCTHQIMFF